VPCDLGVESTAYDLTKKFDRVAIEAVVGDYRADVLITGDDTVILFEIHVEHAVDESKAGGGERIIEIDITSEEDVAKLERPWIDLGAERVRTFNFNIKPRAKKIDSAHCIREASAFVVYQNGKCRLFDREPYGKIASTRGTQRIRWIREEEWPDGHGHAEYFAKLVVEERKRGVMIKNCHLCRYHGLHRDRGATSAATFCKWKKQKVMSNIAGDCEAYMDDPSAYTDVKRVVDPT
jgi:hypothetical protein